MGTKDQAYALFLLSVPVGLGLWLGLDPWARTSARRVLREAGIAVGIAVGFLVLVDEALSTRPASARACSSSSAPPARPTPSTRTTGPAAARSSAISLGHFDHYYPPAFAVLVLVGLVLFARDERRDRTRLVAGLLPMLCIVSFTVAFNCLARRTATSASERTPTRPPARAPPRAGRSRV